MASTGRVFYTCNTCGRILTSPYKLREHMMIHTGEKPHACTECKQAFRTKPDLARHRRIHTGERPYSCTLCGQRFHRSDNLKGHMKVHQFRKPSNPGQEEQTAEQPDTQKKQSTGTKRSQSDGSSKTAVPSTKSRRLNTPEVDSQPVVEGRAKSQPDEAGGTVHIDTVSSHCGVGFHTCGECGSSFSQRGVWAMHMKLVHPNVVRTPSPGSSHGDSPSPAPGSHPAVPETAYVCPGCGKSFEGMESLGEHIQQHHTKQASVDVNENHTQLILTSGRDSHDGTDEGPIIIASDDSTADDNSKDGSQTGRIGSNRLNMEVDEDSLSQFGSDFFKQFSPSLSNGCQGSTDGDTERASLAGGDDCSGMTAYLFKCSFCSKGFMRQDRMVAHLRLHTGKSPHVCSHCGKSFTASSSLKEHLKIHTGEKPFHCPICKKDFRQKCVLTRHLRNVHKWTDLSLLTLTGVDQSVESSSQALPGVSSPAGRLEIKEQDTFAGGSVSPVDFSLPRKDDPVTGTEVSNHTLPVHIVPSMWKAVYQKQTDSLVSPTLLKQLKDPVSTCHVVLSTVVPPDKCSLEKQVQCEKTDSDATANDTDLHRCGFCGKEFESAFILQQHKAISHSDQEEKLSPHRQSTGDGDSGQSPVIPATGPSGNRCSSDYKTVNQDDSSLVYPHFTLPSKNLSKNLPPPTNNSLKCSLCDIVLPSLEKLAEHTESHIKSDPFFCSLCNSTFRDTTALEAHMSSHPEEFDLFKKSSDDEDSTLGSTAEDVLVCNVCKEQLSEWTELEEHMASHCPRSGDLYHCEVCGKNCTTAGEMNRHIALHTSPSGPMERELGPMVYGCNFCCRSFSKVRSLVLHLKTHLVVRPHVCEFCGKGFTQLTYLRQHVRIHTGERPYQCSSCGRGFVQRTQLTLHERHHRGEMPFKCYTCGKAFTNKSVLKLHLLTHLPRPPHRCNLCGRRFTQAGNVRRHIMMVHKEAVQLDDGGGGVGGDLFSTDPDVADLTDGLEVQPLDLSMHPSRDSFGGEEETNRGHDDHHNSADWESSSQPSFDVDVADSMEVRDGGDQYPPVRDNDLLKEAGGSDVESSSVKSATNEEAIPESAMPARAGSGEESDEGKVELSSPSPLTDDLLIMGAYYSNQPTEESGQAEEQEKKQEEEDVEQEQEGEEEEVDQEEEDEDEDEEEEEEQEADQQNDHKGDKNSLETSQVELSASEEMKETDSET